MIFASASQPSPLVSITLQLVLWFSAVMGQWQCQCPPQSDQLVLSVMSCCLVSIECIAVLQSFLCLLLPQLLLLHASNTISFYRHFSSIYQFYHQVALLALCGNVSTLPGVMWCDVCANVGCVRRGRGVWTDNPHVCTYCEGVLLSPGLNRQTAETWVLHLKS